MTGGAGTAGGLGVGAAGFTGEILYTPTHCKILSQIVIPFCQCLTDMVKPGLFYKQHCHSLINRPGVAGAVLQTASQFIHSISLIK